MTITEFLLARIAEDEAVARDDQTRRDAIPVGAGVAVTDWTILINPTRVLAECEAKRRIIAYIKADASAAEFGLRPMVGGPAILMHLASVYADHPDYRREWSGS